MTRFLTWLARMLAIAGILFVSLFALDAPVSGKPWHENVTAIFMHLLPSFALIACLVIAWRWTLLGGVLFVLAGASPLALVANPPWINLVLGAPFLLAGLLFCATNILERKSGRQR